MRRTADVPTKEESYGAEEVKYVNEPRNYDFKQILTYPHITVQHRGTTKISHMVEGHYKAQGMDRILNKDISSHQGSSNSIKEVRAEMTIKVKGGLNHLKNKCCSSWGTTRYYYTSMNRNC